MAAKPIKISAELVGIGMYVCELDRPWKFTPFTVHGFYVRDLNEVKKLKVYCEHVFIDPDKGIVPVEKPPEKPQAVDPADVVFREKLLPVKVNASAYSHVEPMDKEMLSAQSVYDELLDEIHQLMEEVREGQLTSVTRLITLSQAMVDSLVRNPDAFLWLVRVRKIINNPYYYLLRRACWAVVFGRHLGLPKRDLGALALALLLKDIGVFQLSLPMRDAWDNNSNGKVDPTIGCEVLKHTLALLRPLDQVHPKVIKIIKMHGERVNGSGFPLHLSGDEIFLLAKVAGIASYYDEVTYLPTAKCATSVSESVSRLYKVRGTLFQDDIVVEFIQAIGLYPTGTLVKLTSNEIAVVTEQNYQRRLKPKVLVVVDQENKAIDKLFVADLFQQEQQKKSAKVLQKRDIVEDVMPYKYPIKVTKIRTEYIAMSTKKSFFSSLFSK